MLCFSGSHERIHAKVVKEEFHSFRNRESHKSGSKSGLCTSRLNLGKFIVVQECENALTGKELGNYLFSGHCKSVLAQITLGNPVFQGIACHFPRIGNLGYMPRQILGSLKYACLKQLLLT